MRYHNVHTGAVQQIVNLFLVNLSHLSQNVSFLLRVFGKLAGRTVFARTVRGHSGPGRSRIEESTNELVCVTSQTPTLSLAFVLTGKRGWLRLLRQSPQQLKSLISTPSAGGEEG